MKTILTVICLCLFLTVVPGFAQSPIRRPIPPNLEPPNPAGIPLGDSAAKELAEKDPEFIKATPVPSEEVPLYGLLPRGTPDRAVYRCFFDDKTDPNQDRWPDGWTRQSGLDYPEYVVIGIERLPNPVNFRTLRVNVQGGNALLRTPKIPVQSELSYRLRSYVRVNQLQYDTVSVALTYYNQDGQELRSESTKPFQNTSGWREISLGPLPANMPGVAYAQISFLVAQGNRQDFKGTVDIAGIELFDSPTIQLTTNSRNNLFSDPKSVDVRCRLSGLTAEQNQLTMILENPFGETLEQTTVQLLQDDSGNEVFVVDPQQDPLLHRSYALWHVPVSSPGFYRIRLKMDGLDSGAANNQVSLAVLEPLPNPVRGEFGWTLAGKTTKEIQALQSLLAQSGISRLKIPTWLGAKATAQDWSELSTLCESLTQNLKLSLTGLFVDPPEEVLSQVTAPFPNAAGLFSMPLESWFPSVEPSLLYLPLIRNWQLGGDEDRSIDEIDQLFPQVDAIHRAISGVAIDTAVGFGWSWDRPIPETFVADRAAQFAAQRATLLRNAQELARKNSRGNEPVDVVPEPLTITANGREFLALSTDDPLTEEELKTYLLGSQNTNIERSVVLRPISKADYPLVDRLFDLVQRMLIAKIFGAKDVFIPEPFDDQTGLLNRDGTPDELFLPWRTTSLMIAGKEHAGKISLPNLSENLIFSGADGTVMMTWNVGTTRSEPVNEVLFLGTECEIIDLWGKRTRPFREGRSQVIPVGPLPLFVTRLNPDVVLLRQGLTLDQQKIPSQFGPKLPNGFTFQNKTANNISGTVQLMVPTSWKVEPAEVSIDLLGGEQVHVPFSLTLTPRAVSGPQPIRFDLNLDGLQSEVKEFSIYDQIHVGEGDVYLEQPVTRYNARTGNLEVQTALINDSDNLVSFKCSLVIPGRQQEQRTILNQGFGRNDHTFVIQEGEKLLGQQLSFIAREIGGIRTLRTVFQANK